jgi:hypothetical protein
MVRKNTHKRRSLNGTRSDSTLRLKWVPDIIIQAIRAQNEYESHKECDIYENHNTKARMAPINTSFEWDFDTFMSI